MENLGILFFNAIAILYTNKRIILSWRIIEKKTSGHVGVRTCVAGLSQQTCYALDHHASPKKDVPSPELSKLLRYIWLIYKRRYSSIDYK